MASEEIAWAAEITAQRARIAQLEATARTLEAQRDAAEARERVATDSYVRIQDNQRRLEAELSERESQLGTACAEIARLEEQLRQKVGNEMTKRPQFKPGDRVRVVVPDDMFTDRSATVRGRRTRNKPHRFVYTLDIDGEQMKYGAGPYMEDEIAAYDETLAQQTEEEPRDFVVETHARLEALRSGSEDPPHPSEDD